MKVINDIKTESFEDGNKFILKNNINLVKKDSKLYITLKEREIEERIKRL